MLFHIMHNILNLDLTLISQHMDSLHLMEYWVMIFIYLISTIDITWIRMKNTKNNEAF